jgi:hypothetical protein
MLTDLRIAYKMVKEVREYQGRKLIPFSGNMDFFSLNPNPGSMPA